MIKQATDNLYKTIVDNDSSMTYWWTRLLLPYTSFRLDTSSSVVCSVYERYINYAPEIPENIKSLILN